MQFDDRLPTSSLNEAGRGNGVGQADRSQEHQGLGTREWLPVPQLAFPYHIRPDQVPYRVGAVPPGGDQAPLAGTPYSAHLQFEHSGMPVHDKGDTNGLIERAQAPSRSPFAPTSIVRDRFTTNVVVPGPPHQFSPQGWKLPDLPTPLPPTTVEDAPTTFGPDEREGRGNPQRSLRSAFQSPRVQGGVQAIPFNSVIPGTSNAPHMNRIPNPAWPQPQQLSPIGMLQVGSYQIGNPPGMPLESFDAPTKKRSLLLELPHLLGYTVGMLAIFGLYLIIPMMILLNATVPGNWNKLLIAIGILVVGELVICVILVKTIPGRKSKHRHQSVLPGSLSPDQRRVLSPSDRKGHPYISNGSGQVQGGMPLDLIAVNSDEKRRLAAAIAARASDRNRSGGSRPQGSPLWGQAGRNDEHMTHRRDVLAKP